ELLPKPQVVKSESTLLVGEPAGRLIDNFQCQLALCFQAEENFTKGQAIYLHLPTGLEQAQVEGWTQSGDQTYLLCTMGNYNPKWNNLRVLELELATDRKEGIVVPSRALVSQKGKW